MTTTAELFGPDDPITARVRTELREMMTRLARSHDYHGDCSDIELELFVDDLRALIRRTRVSPGTGGRLVLELVHAIDRGAVRLSALHGCSVETALRQVIP